jgi:hypothetical protein
MKKLVPIKDNSSLLRDTSTNAVISNDQTSYKNYMRLKQQKLNDTEKIVKLEDDVNYIKNELDEIKNLLITLLKNESR